MSIKYNVSLVHDRKLNMTKKENKKSFICVERKGNVSGGA